MPRIRQNADVYLRNDFIRAIRLGQVETNLMQKKKLADASGIPYSTLWKRLEHPEDLTITELRKLVGAIHLSPESVLAFVGYSTKDIKKLEAPV